MIIGVAKESKEGESRVALTPDGAKKLIKQGYSVEVTRDAGKKASFPNEQYEAVGAKVVDCALGADIVFKILRPTETEVEKLKVDCLLFCLIDPFCQDDLLNKLAQAKVNCVGLEMVPRTSRAQSMDVLSSQANIAGYRAVLEATQYYPRFLPMMMTSAGMAKAANAIVLGAGVAGLQAIATAKRLGARVHAYDVRPEVKEQIESLGAKFLDLEIEESGSGDGGYAKELSEEGKRRQQEKLTEKLQKADVIISTANIPGKQAPELITETALKGMKEGSVIVDMAAANGGNCRQTEANKVCIKEGVTLIGLTNYPSLMSSDSSQFFANNLINLIALFVNAKEQKIHYNFEDDIVAASLVSYQGEIKLKR